MLAAQKTPVTLKMKETSAPGGWYVDAVTDEACRALSMSADQLMSGGYRIYTAMDPGLQDTVQRTMTNWDNYPKMRSSSDSIFKASLGNGEYLELPMRTARARRRPWRRWTARPASC